MDEDTLPQVAEAVIAYRRYWTTLLQSAEPLWAQLDLTILQLKGLILLEVRDELTIGAIADLLGIGRPSASVLVDQLVKLDLVTRAEDAADRRRSLVRLTQEGRELAARLHRGDEQHMETHLKRLSVDDLAAFTQGLKAIAAVLEVDVD